MEGSGYLCPMAESTRREGGNTQEGGTRIGPEGARRLAREVLKALSDAEVPVLPETLKRLSGIGPEAPISAQELADIVLEDYGLAEKVLRTVNSFYYNRLGQEVTTLTQAVILLGFNTVREIALGMALLDAVPPEASQKVHSLVTKSYLAAGIVRAVGTGEKEELYLSALFHDLAAVVTAVTAPEVLSALETQGGEAAEQEFVRALGRGLGEAWCLPASIKGLMRGLGKGPNYGLVESAHQVAEGIVEGRQDPGALEELAKRAGLPPWEREVLLESLREAVRRTRRISGRLSKALSGPKVERALQGALPAEPGEPEKEDPEEAFLGLLDQLASRVEDRAVGLDAIYLLASEVLYKALSLSRLLFLLLSRDRSRLAPRFGIGEGVRTLKERLSIPFPQQKGPLKAAFERNREVVASWQELGETGAETGPGELVLSPIALAGRPIGCFILQKGGSNGWTGKELRRVQMVRRLVVLATSFRR